MHSSFLSVVFYFIPIERLGRKGKNERDRKNSKRKTNTTKNMIFTPRAQHLANILLLLWISVAALPRSHALMTYTKGVRGNVTSLEHKKPGFETVRERRGPKIHKSYRVNWGAMKFKAQGKLDLTALSVLLGIGLYEDQGAGIDISIP